TLDRDRSFAEFVPQRRPTRSLELSIDGRDPSEIFGIETDNEGLRGVEPWISQQHSHRREVAGLGRHDHARNLERVGELNAGPRPPAAVAEQGELARIEAAGD